MVSVELLEKIINLRIKLQDSNKYKNKNIMIIRATNIVKLLYRENTKTHVIYKININSGDIFDGSNRIGNINSF